MSLPLLDLHDLGLRQTGNETWARGIARGLFQIEGPGSYDIAVTKAAPAEDVAALPARRVVRVGGTSVVRLAWHLPRALRAGGNSAVLVQYTSPLSKVPAVVAVHDLSFEDAGAREWLSPATRLRYRATIRGSVHRAAHVLTLSNAGRDDLVRHYGVPVDRISVAPASVDPRLIALLDSTPEERDGPATVLVVGNVLPRKNVVVVGRAVAILRDRGLDVRLRLVGSVPGSGRPLAAELARLLGDHLVLSGHLSPAGLARAYRSAHVLAFPSLYEGFGIPVLEAMTAGLPVVVSDRGALPEVTGGAGVVVPAMDPHAWADALSSVLAEDTARELADLGRSRAQCFTWAGSAAVVRDVLACVGHSR